MSNYDVLGDAVKAAVAKAVAAYTLAAEIFSAHSGEDAFMAAADAADDAAYDAAVAIHKTVEAAHAAIAAAETAAEDAIDSAASTYCAATGVSFLS